MRIEDELRGLIKERFGSVAEMCERTGLKATTVRGILNGSIQNAHAATIFAITKELGIDAESLYYGKIEYLEDLKNDLRHKADKFITELTSGSYTINGTRATPAEIQEVVEYLNFSVNRVIYNRERGEK